MTREATPDEIVLILVVVEDVLVLEGLTPDNRVPSGLNPCCGGRCSSTIPQN